MSLILAGGCLESPSDLEDEIGGSLSGRLVTLDEGSPAGARVVGRWGALEAEAEVGADGVFELEPSAPPDTSGFLRVRPRSSSGHIPALIPLSENLPEDSLRILLLPGSWTVRDGVHAGTSVEIHPADAADGGVLPGYWGFTFPFEQEGRIQTVLDSTRWTGALVTWGAGEFPIPVAFDRNDSTSDLTAADSADFWWAIDRFEEILGRKVFEPARLEDLPPLDQALGDVIPGAVIVRVTDDLDLRGRGSLVPGEASWFWSDPVGTWSGSRVDEISLVSANAAAGRILFREVEGLRDPTLVMHEAMHVLGAGHGCVWRSVQTYCEAISAPEPTEEDVAYLEVLEETREAEDILGTAHGIVPAVLGERSILRGLSPIPDVALVEP